MAEHFPIVAGGRVTAGMRVLTYNAWHLVGIVIRSRTTIVQFGLAPEAKGKTDGCRFAVVVKTVVSVMIGTVRHRKL